MKSIMPSARPLSPAQRQAAELIAAREVHDMTMQEIADEVGVTLRTIYRWKHDPDFIRYQSDVADTIMDDFLAETYSELRKLLREGSEKTRLKAVEIVLSNRGKLKQQQEITVKQEEMYDPDERRKEVLDMDID